MENNQEKENFPGKMAQNMRETLKIPYDMDLEFKPMHQQMKETTMKATGEMMKNQEQENL
jgi:hypothetical protein